MYSDSLVFRLQSGHNTLNIVNQPENPHDITIIYQVLNHDVSISKELLIIYIKIRLEEENLRAMKTYK